MAFTMARLNRRPSGAFIARKGIPRDVQAEYQRLYGQAWEAKFSAHARTPVAEAKAQHNEWLAEIENRIAAIRAAQRGEGRPLTIREAHGLAGEWYRWWVSKHEENPGDPQGWDVAAGLYVDELEAVRPDWHHEDPRSDPSWEWRKEPEARAAVRPWITDTAETAQFLATRGLALSKEAHALFIDCVADNFFGAVRLLEQRAKGDYTPDDTPESFPPFTPKGSVGNSAKTCWALFEAWVGEKQRKRSFGPTLQRAT